jgi:hypothetical protein
MDAVNLPGYKQRIAILGIGLLGDSLIGYAFDYALYPWVIWKLGLLHGAIVMTAVSFLVCYATILFYDWAKKDWLGIETLKELREYAGTSRLVRVLKWAVAKGDAALLVILSVWTDPFITVAYMRQGAHQYNGMSGRDWRIFLLSVVIGNGSWTLTLFTGLTVAEYAWEALSGAWL